MNNGQVIPAAFSGDEAPLPEQIQPQDAVLPPAIPDTEPPAEELPPATLEGAGTPLTLNEVVASVHSSFPLLEVAYLESDIAEGKQLAAWGAFDTKLKAASENGPLGFYETYRHNAGFTKPIYRGGDAFGGYRIGRGVFQPWYLERQTNEGGEFKAGFRVPLLRNRKIDERRADLWRANYELQRVQPEIRTQLVMFVRDATVAYWVWIAAARQVNVGRRALKLAVDRNSQLERKVELGDLDPPALKDNQRAIAQRESKLIDRERKLQQSAIKLSLFYRAGDGMPLTPTTEQMGEFPAPRDVNQQELEAGIQTALGQRPELVELDALARKVDVDLAEAENDLLPTVDAQVIGSQDMGEPTSSKRDKSPFELEAALFVDVPLQRRKAQGKAQAARAKLAQITTKRRFVEDKIVVEVRAAFTALQAAFDRMDKAREARELAVYMAEVEDRKFRLGQSDLLSVYLRERVAIEAADAEIEALLEYYVARADFAASQAIDWPTDDDAAPKDSE